VKAGELERNIDGCFCSITCMLRWLKDSRIINFERINFMQASYDNNADGQHMNFGSLSVFLIWLKSEHPQDYAEVLGDWNPPVL